MEKCTKCGIKYPHGYTQPIMTSQGNAVVCGICALEISNEVLGITRTEFGGEIAEEMRQKAIEYREQNNL